MVLSRECCKSKCISSSQLLIHQIHKAEGSQVCVKIDRKEKMIVPSDHDEIDISRGICRGVVFQDDEEEELDVFRREFIGYALKNQSCKDCGKERDCEDDICKFRILSFLFLPPPEVQFRNSVLF